MRYVENHDEDRYTTECDEGTLRPAAAATFTLPGASMIYYGQERGVLVVLAIGLADLAAHDVVSAILTGGG